MPNLKLSSLVALAGLMLTGPIHAQTAPAPVQPPSIATATVDAMNKLWGSYPGTRANHAKGVVANGTFTPSPEAASLSTASIFKGGPIPVTVRFSDSTGVPKLPDGADLANPHGLALKFRPAGGGEVDVVTNSLKFFPVATGEQFLDLLNALAASGPEAPKPTPAQLFFEAHPAALPSFASSKTPTSFAHETYYGVNAFIFVDAAGKRQPFRFQFVPVAGEEHLSDADAAKMPPDFLMDELAQRIAKEPVAFRVMAQLANAGDQTKDSSQPWPADRRLVDLGTVSIMAVVPDSATTQKTLAFFPNRLTPGIEVSDDPMIDSRVRAYVISFGRRLK